MAITPLYVNNLESKTTLSDDDLVIIGEGNDAKKMTIAQLKEELGINALNTNKSNLISVEYKTWADNPEAIPANSSVDFSMDVKKDGYTPIGIVSAYHSMNAAAVYVSKFSLTNGNANITLANRGSSQAGPGYAVCHVLYVKN